MRFKIVKGMVFRVKVTHGVTTSNQMIVEDTFVVIIDDIKENDSGSCTLDVLTTNGRVLWYRGTRSNLIRDFYNYHELCDQS